MLDSLNPKGANTGSDLLLERKCFSAFRVGDRPNCDQCTELLDVSAYLGFMFAITDWVGVFSLALFLSCWLLKDGPWKAVVSFSEQLAFATGCTDSSMIEQDFCSNEKSVGLSS